MHALGGIVAALAFISLYDFRFPLPKRWFALIPVIAFVLIIALGWELYEILIGVPILEDANYELDTIIDLIMGALGGAIGYYIGTQIKKL